jgi:RNA polymerase sigma factor (sigma-70 family)
VDGLTLSRLVQDAQSDERAFAALVDEFSGMVWGIARAFRLDRADAADVSQVVWLRLATHLGRIERPETIAGWLKTTTTRECLSLLRRNGRTRPMGLDLNDGADRTALGPDDSVIADERHRALWTAFRSLPEGCQTLLRLMLVNPPLTYTEIAEILGVPRGSLGPTRARCIDKLRRHPALAQLRDEVAVLRP